MEITVMRPKGALQGSNLGTLAQVIETIYLMNNPVRQENWLADHKH